MPTNVPTKMSNLEIAHQTRGRVRMKIPAGKGNPELLEQIKETFGVIPGIEDITVNPTTGSVVVLYDADRHDDFHDHFGQHYGAAAAGYKPPSTEIDELAQRIEDEAEFLAQNSDTARAIVDFVKTLDRNVKRATHNTIDLKILFAMAIIGFTVFEVGATAATPVWVTLAIFMVNHFIEMHPHHGPGHPAPGQPAPAAAHA
jgi:hypothetical protein